MQVTQWRLGMTLTGERVVVLGFFDGVHMAHRRLLALAAEAARTRRAELCVFTFSSECVQLKRGAARLYTTEEKLRLLAEAGVEHTVLADFASVASLTAEQFVDDVLCRALGCVYGVCGFNFRFAAHAAADAQTLLRLLRLRGRDGCVGEAVLFSGEPLSATLIRRLLAAGDVRTAALALGAPYRMVGRAEHGRGVGRSLGVPTVNLSHTDGMCYPARGVYRSVAVVDGIPYHAVTNVGTCPTFGARPEHTESTLIGYEGDLYGRTVRILFLDRLRDERSFSGAQELKAQIEQDKQTTVEQNPSLDADALVEKRGWI